MDIYQNPASLLEREMQYTLQYTVTLFLPAVTPCY